MIRLPPRSTRTDTLFPYTTLFRSKKGDWVFGLHGSANRDEAVFERAKECLLEREPNQHLAFGSGAHICLGRNLARLELRILLNTMLERCTDFEVGPQFTPEYLVGEARGMKCRPVRFTPAQQSDRKSGVEGKRVSDGVDLGGHRFIKKKKK